MADLEALVLRLAKDGPHKTLATPRLVQALFNGKYIVKTTRATYLWEIPFFPQLYLPQSALTEHVTIKTETPIKLNNAVIAHKLDLQVGDKTITRAYRFATHLSGAAAPLSGLLKIDFSAVDQWFEESTPIFVHPKDPFRRVDVLASTRRVRVLIDDVVVADAASSMHLYETGLPARYYLPFTSLRADVLRPSGTRTRCPYKGEAEYYSVEINGTVHEDVVWYYRHPLLESIKIEGLCCFYNEKVTIEVDGEVLERPVTFFSASAKPPAK